MWADMTMKKFILALTLLIIILILAAPLLAQLEARYDLHWQVLSGGGAERSSSHYQITDVLGQWPDGLSQSETYRIDPGFWHAGGSGPKRFLYLPVVQRQ